MSIMAKASFWALVSGLIQKGVSVLATPIFTRILSTEDFAQFTLYQSWQDIFIIFVSMNVFNYATYTAMVKFEYDKDGFITSAQTLVTILTIAWMDIYYVIHTVKGEIFDFPLYIVILMFADILFMSSYNLWATRKRFEFQYQIMTIVSIILGIARPLLGILLTKLAKTNLGYGRIYGYAAINIIIGCILYVVNLSKSRKGFNLAYWKYIFTFCIPLIPHFLSTQILSRFDRIMIKKMCSVSDVAIYGLAYSLSMLMLIVSDAVLNSVTPWMYQCIKEEKKGDIKHIVNTTLLLVSGANMLLILFAPEAVRLFAPIEYYEAIYIIPAVSASVYFMFLFNIFANIEYYYSETKYVAVASVAAALLNVVLNMIFIDMYGYIAAGYTTLASYILYSIGHFIFMKIVSKKHADGYHFFDTKFIVILSCLFTILSLLILLIYQMAWIRYVLIVVLMSAAIWKKETILSIIKRK